MTKQQEQVGLKKRIDDSGIFKAMIALRKTLQTIENVNESRYIMRLEIEEIERNLTRLDQKLADLITHYLKRDGVE